MNVSGSELNISTVSDRSNTLGDEDVNEVEGVPSTELIPLSKSTDITSASNSIPQSHDPSVVEGKAQDETLDSSRHTLIDSQPPETPPPNELLMKANQTVIDEGEVDNCSLLSQPMTESPSTVEMLLSNDKDCQKTVTLASVDDIHTTHVSDTHMSPVKMGSSGIEMTNESTCESNEEHMCIMEEQPQVMLEESVARVDQLQEIGVSDQVEADMLLKNNILLKEDAPDEISLESTLQHNSQENESVESTLSPSLSEKTQQLDSIESAEQNLETESAEQNPEQVMNLAISLSGDIHMPAKESSKVDLVIEDVALKSDQTYESKRARDDFYDAPSSSKKPKFKTDQEDSTMETDPQADPRIVVQPLSSGEKSPLSKDKGESIESPSNTNHLPLLGDQPVSTSISIIVGTNGLGHQVGVGEIFSNPELSMDTSDEDMSKSSSIMDVQKPQVEEDVRKSLSHDEDKPFTSHESKSVTSPEAKEQKDANSLAQVPHSSLVEAIQDPGCPNPELVCSADIVQPRETDLCARESPIGGCLVEDNTSILTPISISECSTKSFKDEPNHTRYTVDEPQPRDAKIDEVALSDRLLQEAIPSESEDTVSVGEDLGTRLDEYEKQHQMQTNIIDGVAPNSPLETSNVGIKESGNEVALLHSEDLALDTNVSSSIDSSQSSEPTLSSKISDSSNESVPKELFNDQYLSLNEVIETTTTAKDSDDDILLQDSEKACLEDTRNQIEMNTEIPHSDVIPELINTQNEVIDGPILLDVESLQVTQLPSPPGVNNSKVTRKQTQDEAPESSLEAALDEPNNEDLVSPMSLQHSCKLSVDKREDSEDDEVSDAETSDGGAYSEKKAPSSFIEDKKHKSWKKLILMVWREIVNDRFGAVFMHPIKEQAAPGYYGVIKQPMDLKSIKQRIREGVITSTDEFHRDILLMFQNALMYNKTDSEIYQMAVEMRDRVEQEIQAFKKTEVITEPETPTTRRKANYEEI
ncbi:hypothetical protein K7432_005201 [Basidiobolus ranarum]